MNALSILGDSYITDLSKAFDEKWIDVMPSHGKKVALILGVVILLILIAFEF